MPVESEIKVDIKHILDFLFFSRGFTIGNRNSLEDASLLPLFAVLPAPSVFFQELRMVLGFVNFTLPNPPPQPTPSHLLRNMCTCQRTRSSQKRAFLPPQIKHMRK